MKPFAWVENENKQEFVFGNLFVGLECVGHSLTYVAHFVFFFRDVCIRTQRAAVASRRATNLAIHLSI
jgi:hypothetical protein